MPIRLDIDDSTKIIESKIQISNLFKHPKFK